MTWIWEGFFCRMEGDGNEICVNEWGGCHLCIRAALNKKHETYYQLLAILL